MEGNQIFLDRFTKLLKEKNISRTEFSRLSGISYSTITGWYQDIRRTKNIKLSNLIDLAKYLDCSIDYLVGISDTEKKINTDNFINATIEEKTILNKYRALDNRGQQNFKGILDIELINKDL